jgi:hypothetical protein
MEGVQHNDSAPARLETSYLMTTLLTDRNFLFPGILIGASVRLGLRGGHFIR